MSRRPWWLYLPTRADEPTDDDCGPDELRAPVLAPIPTPYRPIPGRITP